MRTNVFLSCEVAFLFGALCEYDQSKQGARSATRGELDLCLYDALRASEIILHTYIHTQTYLVQNFGGVSFSFSFSLDFFVLAD